MFAPAPRFSLSLPHQFIAARRQGLPSAGRDRANPLLKQQARVPWCQPGGPRAGDGITPGRSEADQREVAVGELRDDPETVGRQTGTSHVK
jgi:hypothetical protein